MLRAVKICIYPDKEQETFLEGQFGAVRKVYNTGLAIISNRYKKHGESLRATRDIKPLLVIAKRSRKYNWLKTYDSIALQEACRHLDQAFSNFFQKRSRYPRFKSKRGFRSSYHCTGIDFNPSPIKLPKLKTRIKARVHRIIEGQLKSITVSRTLTGKYFASLLIDTKEVSPVKPNKTNLQHQANI